MWKRIAFVLALILVWQVVASLGLYNQLLLPSPIEIGKGLIALGGTGGLFVDILMSLKRVLTGFAIAVALGLGIAIAFAFWKPVADYVGTVLELIRPIPPIAWIPIAILWFGVGDKPAVFIVALGSFFPIFVSSFQGIKEVDPKALLVAKSFGARKGQLLKEVYLPLTLPYLISGMRIGLGVGWMSLITAELVGAQSGLGYMMQLNRVLLQTQNVMVGMITIGILGFGLNRMMLQLEKAATPWKT